MDTLHLLIRLAVATIFGVAGLAKLLDLPGSVAAAEGFGVPQRFSRLVGYGLSVLEIAIAVGLVSVTTARPAAATGTLLTALFIAAIAVNLAHGKRPDCHCFGKLHSAPIGWQTLARNAAIGVGAATVAVAGPGEKLVPWLQRLDATDRALLAVLVSATVVIGWQWTVVERLSRTASVLGNRIATIEGLVNGDRSADVPGPEVGALAPGFLLRAIGKGFVSRDGLTGLGRPVLLVFAEPTCSVCTTMMPKLARRRQELASVLTIAVISTGTEEANRRKVDRFGLEWVLLQERREVTMAYRVPGTPAAVLIDRTGNVAAPLVYGPDPIHEMLQEIAVASRTAAGAAASCQSSSITAAPVPTTSGAD